MEKTTNKGTKRWITWLLVAVGVVLLVGVGVWYQGQVAQREAVVTEPPGGETPERITLGLTGTPDILDIPYFIAEREGLFEQAGLEVTFKRLEGDANTVRAVIHGDIDVGSGGTFAVIRAVKQGADIKAFWSIQNSHDYSLVTSKSVKDLQNLRGKKIAIYSPGDITETVVVTFLESKGIPVSEVKLVSLGGSDARFAALSAGRVDGAVLHLDLATEALASGEFHALAVIYKEKPLPMSVLSARTDVLANRGAALLKLVTALSKAVRVANEDERTFLEVARDVLGEEDEQSIRTAYSAVREGEIWSENGGLTEERVTNAIEAVKLTDELPAEFGWEDVFDSAIIRSFQGDD